MQNNSIKVQFLLLLLGFYCNCKLYHFAFFRDNGMLNKTIFRFRERSWEINWYSESKYWPVILVIANT